MQDWLWSHQPGMAADSIRRAAAELTGVDPGWESTIVAAGIAADVSLGISLGVVGTPTYFVNGVKLERFDETALEEAVVFELRRADTPK